MGKVMFLHVCVCLGGTWPLASGPRSFVGVPPSPVTGPVSGPALEGGCTPVLAVGGRGYTNPNWG